MNNKEQLKQDMDKFLLDLGINNIFDKELYGSLKDRIAVAINNQSADEEFRNIVRDGLSQAKIQINAHMTAKDDFWIEDIENGFLAGKVFEIDLILEQL
jgi:plasmid stability protein